MLYKAIGIAEQEKHTELCGKAVRVLERHDEPPKEFRSKLYVFLIGYKGIPALYGGFETFVEKLVEY